MEPLGSLPHSQVLATCPYPVPARSSPYPHIPIPENPSYFYPPFHSWVSQEVSFPRVSPPTPCICLSSVSYALHTPPISFFSILSTKQYWVRSTHRSLSSSLCSFLHSLVISSLLGPNILLSTLFSETFGLRSSLNTIMKYEGKKNCVWELIRSAPNCVKVMVFFYGWGLGICDNRKIIERPTFQ